MLVFIYLSFVLLSVCYTVLSWAIIKYFYQGSQLCLKEKGVMSNAASINIDLEASPEGEVGEI